MTFYATINDKGEIVFNNLSQAHNRLKQLSGKRVVVEVEQEKTSRSTQQNKFLWSAIYGTIEQETGQDLTEIHEWCKSQFLPTRIVTVLGKSVKMKGSTAKLSKLEFGDYVDKIRAYFADFQISFPVQEIPEEWQDPEVKVVKNGRIGKFEGFYAS